MEERNDDLIKGGLPLSSSDFVNKEEAQQKKSKLLSALNNINKLHEKQLIKQQETQQIQNTTPSEEHVNLDNYILSKDVQKSVEPSDNVVFTVSNPVDPNSAQEIESEPGDEFTNEYVSTDTPEINESDKGISEPLTVEEKTSQDEPMYVVGEEGKKGKGKKGKNVRKGYVRVSSDEEVKAGKGIAWLAYILFFIPLLINGKNNFVRHHANEGLEVNIIDVLAIALIVVGKTLKSDNSWATLGLMAALIAGICLLILTTLTKLVLIIMSLAGKEGRSPWLGSIKIIKPKKN